MAIAFDAAGGGQGTGTTVDFSALLTVGSGSNRLLVCSLEQDTTGTDDLTSVSWDQDGTPQAMTLIGKSSSNGFYNYLYRLVAPTSGALKLRVVGTGSRTWRVALAAYTGVDQTNPIDSSAVNNFTTAASFTTSTTVVGSNCWLVCGAFVNGQPSHATAGAGTIWRGGSGVGSVADIFDSNGTVGTGSQSLVINCSGSNNFAKTEIASIAPAAAATTNGNFFAFF